MAKILVLEDDRDLADQWLEAVTGVGHDCLHATRLDEARRVLQSRPIDGLIIDLYLKDERGKLSGEGGLLLITELLTDRPFAKRPWSIAVTGMTFPPSVDFDPLQTARELGADVVMHKPIAIEKLMGSIDRLIHARDP